MKAHFLAICLVVFAGLAGVLFYVAEQDKLPAAVERGIEVVHTTVPTGEAEAHTDDEDDEDEENPRAMKEKARKPQPYIEIVGGCSIVIDYSCVRAFSRPQYMPTAAQQLRVGMVLPVTEIVTDEQGNEWYKVKFTEWLRYPYRVADPWYIPATENIRLLSDVGPLEMSTSTEPIATTTKYILVDRSDQRLYAYEYGEVVIEQDISTGLALTPTPRGEFTVFYKTPSRYMQGPIEGLGDPDDFYDLPGVPWNLYFTKEGAVVHGAYWHNQFGQQWSHGCVNLPPNRAEELYRWADIGITVFVQD